MEKVKNDINPFFVTRDVTDEEEPCYFSTIAFKQQKNNLGLMLYNLEACRKRNKRPKAIINTRKYIFTYLLLYDKNCLLDFLSLDTVTCDLDDLKIFFFLVKYVESLEDIKILNEILKSLDQKEAEELISKHNKLYDKDTLKEYQNQVVDHLKALSEHLLDTAPARSLVKNNIPINIKYK